MWRAGQKDEAGVTKVENTFKVVWLPGCSLLAVRLGMVGSGEVEHFTVLLHLAPDILRRSTCVYGPRLCVSGLQTKPKLLQVYRSWRCGKQLGGVGGTASSRQFLQQCHSGRRHSLI